MIFISYIRGIIKVVMESFFQVTRLNVKRNDQDQWDYVGKWPLFFVPLWHSIFFPFNFRFV